MLQNNLHLPGQYYHFEVDGQNRLGVLQLRHALVLQCLPEKIRELKSCMELASYAKLSPSHSFKLEGLEDLRVGRSQSLPLCFQAKKGET